MLLKYFVEFAEVNESFGKDDLSEQELENITKEINNAIYDALTLAGFNIHEDKIKVEFDLEE